MLTDLKARPAKARENDYKISDAAGLYLFITTKGHKSWRMKYRFGGKEKRLTVASIFEQACCAGAIPTIS